MRPTTVEIDLESIGYNLKEIQKKVCPSKIMAVVKANAYGHGAAEVARCALKNGAEYLAVALLEEAIELRRHEIEAPVLIFGGELSDQIDELLHYDFEITLYSLEMAKIISEKALARKKKVSVHVKLDTGMGRVGVPYQSAAQFVETCYGMPGIEIKGIYTHFATSDEFDKKFANEQLYRFKQALKAIKNRNIHIQLIHAANSGAILDMPDSYFNMVRPGIMMYGYYPSSETSESVEIKPAMTLRSKIIHLKDVPVNTPVSYGRTYYTPEATKIATIPIGYADGYNRLLSNKGRVSIHGKSYPVAGRVCMDQILIDVGKDFDGKIGDEVILFSPKTKANDFTVMDICNIINTIPYEVCCWVSRRVPRIYKQEFKTR